ncbi:PAS/PAC sensor signal transduction histidine kinase [Candidatus Magnetobacterium bavaricum]|uniref:histidine kinase n=1 Tax=Candidatus Magnetobacterium bavaricum TaxID=29290 RepID=A0A0F3GNZ0_9BACT|nr:PAS/PAC sensor signal transduction histidine kinase [Candidatus Magnetobacterium bavaricum]
MASLNKSCPIHGRGQAGRAPGNPLVFLVVTVFFIFLCEFIIVLFLDDLAPRLRFHKELVDAVMLSLMLPVMLYYFLFLPLRMKSLDSVRRVRKDAERLNQDLRGQVSSLQETEILYRSLMEAIPDIVYKIDLNGNFTFVSSAVRVLGYEPDELVGRHFSTIIAPEEVEYVSREAVLPRYMGKVLGEHHSPKLFDERRTLTRSTRGLEIHIIKKRDAADETAHQTHNTIVGEINSSGVYRLDPDGSRSEFIGTLGIIKATEQWGSSGVIRDITVRKQEVDSLLRLKKIMEDITQGVSDSMSLMTDDFRILWANKATEDNTGYKIDELIGKHCYEVTHNVDSPCDSPLHPCPLKEVMTTSKPTTMLHAHLDKHGNKRYVEVTVYCISEGEDDGSTNRYIYVSKDVTEKKNMEESLFELNRLLEERVHQETMLKVEKEQLLIQQSKMASMGEMINSITHQWKQPLNAISVMVMELAEAHTFGELDNNYLNKMRDNIQQQVLFMSKTMDDFKNFLRPSKEKVSFDIKQATEDIIAMFSPLFKKGNIHITLHSPVEETFEVSGYPNEFKQVILNLINNSRDAIVSTMSETPTEGRIDIGISNEGGIILTIRDNGGGISPELLPRIFEPYFTTKSSDKGTGIGLYISKTIIEDNMGWHITARNIDGGAEFRIEILSEAMGCS